MMRGEQRSRCRRPRKIRLFFLSFSLRRLFVCLLRSVIQKPVAFFSIGVLLRRAAEGSKNKEITFDLFSVLVTKPYCQLDQPSSTSFHHRFTFFFSLAPLVIASPFTPTEE